jgi:hypothetical protein
LLSTPPKKVAQVCLVFTGFQKEAQPVQSCPYFVMSVTGTMHTSRPLYHLSWFLVSIGSKPASHIRLSWPELASLGGRGAGDSPFSSSLLPPTSSPLELNPVLLCVPQTVQMTPALRREFAALRCGPDSLFHSHRVQFWWLDPRLSGLEVWKAPKACPVQSTCSC